MIFLTKYRHSTLCILLLLLLTTSRAQKVSYEAIYASYLDSDGLSSNECHFLYEDDRHFLWICTDEGMSRFDGKTFRHYDVEDGLPDPFVIKLKRLPSGRTIGWTLNGGLFWLEADQINPSIWISPSIKNAPYRL